MLDFHVAKGKSTDALSEARWPDGKGRIDRAYTLAGERLWRRPSWESHLPVPYKGRNSPHKPTLLQKAEHSPRSGQWPELHWIKLGRLSPNKAVQSGVFLKDFKTAHSLNATPANCCGPVLPLCDSKCRECHLLPRLWNVLSLPFFSATRRKLECSRSQTA